MATLPFETRLLFVGLWGIADREGRLEDRPERIRVDIFPYDGHLNVDAMLWQLHTSHFIHRYQYRDTFYISIPTFHLHQHPHINETGSTIPAPDKAGASTRVAPTLYALNLDPVSKSVTKSVTIARTVISDPNVQGYSKNKASTTKNGNGNHREAVTRAAEGFQKEAMKKRGVDLNPALTKAAREQEAEESRTKGKRFR